MSDPQSLLGVGVALGVPIVGALLWIGSLRQRVAALEVDLGAEKEKAETAREKQHACTITITRLEGRTEAAHDLAARVDEAIARLETKLDRALGLPATPPQGLPRTTR